MISATALRLIVDLTEALRGLEWEGSDATAMPQCHYCHRDPPGFETREEAGYDRTDYHDATCGWLALMDRADAYLGKQKKLAVRSPRRDPHA